MLFTPNAKDSRSPHPMAIKKLIENKGGQETKKIIKLNLILILRVICPTLCYGFSNFLSKHFCLSLKLLFIHEF